MLHGLTLNRCKRHVFVNTYVNINSYTGIFVLIHGLEAGGHLQNMQLGR